MSESIFPPTHWSVVLEAAGAEPDKARRAFEHLCGEYRNAIAHWMRLQRLTPEDAEDAAHSFLEKWLQRENPLRDLRRGERRFRDYLSTCLRNFLRDWHEHRGAKKRGGEAQHVAWDHDEMIGDEASSASHFDFALACQIHNQVLAQLKAAWANKLSREHFDRLQSVALGQAANPGSAALARELDAPVNTIKGWIFRLRREYHEAFRDAVSRHTDPSETDGDVMHLHGLLLQPPAGADNNFPDRLQPPPPISR